MSDIDYFFESRLRDEPEPVEDLHFHAAIPRSARVALRVSFYFGKPAQLCNSLDPIRLK